MIGRVAMAAGLLSLGATAAAAIAGGLDPRPTIVTAWAAAEVVGLCVVTVLSIRRARSRAGFLAAILCAASVPAWVLRFGGEPEAGAVAGAVLGCTLVATAAAATGLYLRTLDVARVRAIGEARRTQRLALARDLHDYVAHDLVGILARARAAQVAGGHGAAVTDAVSRIEQDAKEALARLEHTVRALDAVEGHAVPALPSLAELPGLVDRFSSAGQVRADLDLALDDATIARCAAGDAAAVAHRVVVESLTNVRKHAPAATRVHVRVSATAGSPALLVTVRDDAEPRPGLVRRSSPVRPAAAGIADPRSRRRPHRRSGATPRLAGDGGGAARCRDRRHGETVTRATQVLLADDHPEVRAAFRFVLDAQPDMSVVAEADDGVAAIDLAHRLRPDVVLVDVRMPGLDGLEVTRRLAGPDVTDPIPVVVVTTFGLDEYVRTALVNGACGYVLKRSTPQLLVEAVRAAVAGEALICPEVTVGLLRELTAPAAGAPRPVVTPPLTPRERDVVRLLAGGSTNVEIGEQLHLAVGTVKNHVAAIQAKLGTGNRVGIAAWAWASGVLQPPPARPTRSWHRPGARSQRTRKGRHHV